MCSCNRCPNPVYFDTPLLIIYLSAIETFICHRKIEFIGFTLFGFAENTIHDFQNTVLTQGTKPAQADKTRYFRNDSSVG